MQLTNPLKLRPALHDRESLLLLQGAELADVFAEYRNLTGWAFPDELPPEPETESPAPFVEESVEIWPSEDQAALLLLVLFSSFAVGIVLALVRLWG